MTDGRNLQNFYAHLTVHQTSKLMTLSQKKAARYPKKVTKAGRVKSKDELVTLGLL